MASTLVQRPVLDSVERSRDVTRRLLGCADRWRHEVRPLTEDRSYTRYHYGTSTHAGQGNFTAQFSNDVYYEDLKNKGSSAQHVYTVR